ncbi:hypothetical protein AB0I91_13750 [Actinosynnema sp. NPDC049800]
MKREVESVPPHVRVVRRVAFMTIGVSETILIFGPLFVRTYNAVLGSMDASDWIAFGAVAVAIVGIWFARRSARAAEVSAQIARDALAIARDSAGSAATSARAAERSADADSRMAAIIEAQHHEERAPKWVASLDLPKRGYCLVRLRYDAGPNECNANLTANGIYWLQSEGRPFKSEPLYKTATREQIHPSQEWHVRLKMPLHADADRMKLTISVISVERRGEEEDSAEQPWTFVKALEWRRSEPPRISDTKPGR